MVRIVCVLLSCSLIGVVSAPAAAHRGRAIHTLDAIGGVDHFAYREGPQQGAAPERWSGETDPARAESAALGADTDLARLEEESRRIDEEIRAGLAIRWEEIGLPIDEARSVAAAWQWTEQQDAIIWRVRRKGLDATARDIGSACRSYDYLLANQLLLAYFIVGGETDAKGSTP